MTVSKVMKTIPINMQIQKQKPSSKKTIYICFHNCSIVYSSGNAITAAAITQPFHVCTTLKSKFSMRNFPKGLLRLKINSKKKPATVGGSTSGIVRIPSHIALDTGFIFIILRAQKIPRKKAIIVATAPVFKEIHNLFHIVF